MAVHVSHLSSSALTYESPDPTRRMYAFVVALYDGCIAFVLVLCDVVFQGCEIGFEGFWRGEEGLSICLNLAELQALSFRDTRNDLGFPLFMAAPPCGTRGLCFLEPAAGRCVGASVIILIGLIINGMVTFVQFVVHEFLPHKVSSLHTNEPWHLLISILDGGLEE